MLAIQTNKTAAISIIKDLSEDARAFKAYDESMIDAAKHYPQSIMVGDEVIFDPRRVPMPGDTVVAKLMRPDRIVIRKYAQFTRPDGGIGIRLIPLNTYFEENVIAHDDDGFILGRVRRVQSGRNL
jgi:SOS-response transcriptional repressor LexA